MAPPRIKARRRFLQHGVGLVPHFAIIAVSILFDGLAYAMFLFITSVGLSVTMGLMGFVNLAHGVFAAAGGYSLNRRLCMLERLDRRAPDSVALMCGVATLLRQFHPCYGEVCRACVTVVTSNPKTQLLPAPALPSRDARATWCQGCLTSCLRW